MAKKEIQQLDAEKARLMLEALGWKMTKLEYQGNKTVICLEKEYED